MLPLSTESETGTCVPVRGMGLNDLCVPLHKVVLNCELFLVKLHAASCKFPQKGAHMRVHRGFIVVQFLVFESLSGLMPRKHL